MSLRSLISKGTKWRTLLLAVLVTFCWLFLWYFPWQTKLHHIYWFQLAIALAIFIAPGFCVYGLLSHRSQLEFNHLTFGFTISLLIFAVLGTAGRLFHLSFDLITFLMGIVGLLLLILFVFFKAPGIRFQMDSETRAYLLSTLPFLLISALACLIVIQRVLGNDDLTYLAYTTRWQHSAHLDFNDPIFGLSQLAPARFWLMSAPFAQAFLAKISMVPGILISGGYYEPFLMILSVLSWYELALALKFSPRAASASVISQLTFFLLFSEYLHPGAPFFDQLSADKATAAFVLVPVFFLGLIRLLEKRTRNNILLVLSTGLSLMFMHPIILAFSVFMGGMFVLLNRDTQDLRSKLVPGIILIAILIPYALIRFVQVPGVHSGSFDPEVTLGQRGSEALIARWVKTPFYGFNPQILTMKIPYAENIPLPEQILQWGWLVVPIFAVIVALRQWKTGASQFILSCFALAFLTWLPLTGWIFGYFLNARMLARSVWLFPFGISATFLLLSIRNMYWPRSERKIPHRLVSAWPLTTLTVFSTALFLLFMRENSLPDFEKFMLKSIRYQGLAAAGQTLDQLIPAEAVVIGSATLNDLIPGISWKSQVITFRTDTSAMAYFTAEEKDTRRSDTEEIFSPSTSSENKMLLLRKYNVQFLLLQKSDMKVFKYFFEKYPSVTVTEIGAFYIVQIY